MFLQPFLKDPQEPSPQQIEAVYSIFQFSEPCSSYLLLPDLNKLQFKSLSLAFSIMNTTQRRNYLLLFAAAYHIHQAHQAPFAVNHLKHFHISFVSLSMLSWLALVSPLRSTPSKFIASLHALRWALPEAVSISSRAEGLFHNLQVVSLFTLQNVICLLLQLHSILHSYSFCGFIQSHTSETGHGVLSVK